MNQVTPVDTAGMCGRKEYIMTNDYQDTTSSASSSVNETVAPPPAIPQPVNTANLADPSDASRRLQSALDLLLKALLDRE